jgi:hypothetical protein
VSGIGRGSFREMALLPGPLGRMLGHKVPPLCFAPVGTTRVFLHKSFVPLASVTGASAEL